MDNTQSTSNQSEASVSAEAPPVVIIKSSRKRLSYETDRNDDEKASCIICNEEKKEKGRTVPITVITLQDEETKKHYAEETLLKYADIHVRHNTSFKVAGERIFVQKKLKALWLMWDTTGSVMRIFEVQAGIDWILM